MRDLIGLERPAAVLVVCLLLVTFSFGATGCLEKKPVPQEDEKSIASEVVEDRPAPSSVSADVASETASSSSSSVAAEEDEGGATDEKDAEGSALGVGTARSDLLANFVALSQYPELPNGCEITSLAAVLNYYGYPVAKTTLSDSYLAKAPVGQADFYQEFVGDPRDDDAYGCYSPVIVAAANSYLSSMGSGMVASSINGATADELYSYIDRGVPVIVWATRYLEAGHYSVTWYVDGQALTWYTPEHCLALVGYDADAGTVQLADPLEGTVVSYDMDLFERRYSELKNQAVVIE